MISCRDFAAKIQEIAPSISEDTLCQAVHQPEPTARFGHCFYNVLEKMERDGGNIYFGWTFGHRANPKYGEYMVVTHHAVWGLNRKLIDVTPFSEKPGLNPIKNGDSIIFLVDTGAKPIRTRNILAPLPNRYFPLSNSPELKAYVDKVTEEEMDECQEIYEGKYTHEQISGLLKRKS